MPTYYAVKQILPFSIHRLMQVESILFKCGKNMADKDDLHHWDNTHIKNVLVVILCVLKNSIYIVYDKKIPVATFQTRKNNEKFLFEKLAVTPEHAGGV